MKLRKRSSTSEFRFLNLTAVFSAALILALEVWNLYSLNRNHNYVGWVNHSHQVIENSNELLSTAVMAESWARGYALTGDAYFLRVYYQSKNLMLPLIDQLKKLTVDNPEQSRRVDSLEKLVLARIESMEEIIKITSDSEYPDLTISEKMLEGSRISVMIKAVDHRLVNEEERILNARLDDLANEYKTFRTLIIIASSISLAIMLILYLFLFRQMERRAKMEQELSLSREWFSKTLASLSDGMIATNDSGLVTFMNNAAEKLTGWNREEAIGKPLDFVFDITDEETGQPLINPAKKALNERRVIGMSNHTVLRRKDGSQRYIDDSAAPIFNDNGEIFGAALICRDITEQVETRKKLTESEVRLRRIIENSTAIVTIRDRQGNYLMVNPAFEQLTGLKESEIIGKRSAPTIRLNLKADEIQNVMRVVQEDTVITNEEEWVVADGTLRNFIAIRFPIKDDDGKMVGIGSICTDITRQKQQLQSRHEMILKEKILEGQAHYKELANNISEMFFSMDQHEHFLFWNHACEWRTGRHEADVVGKTMDEVYPTDDWPELKVRLRRALRTKQADTFASEYHEKGKTYVMQVYVYPASHGISVLMSDVTFQRKTEREAMKLVESLQQKNKDLRQFAYIISHNLRAPIAKIQGLADLFNHDDGSAEFNGRIINGISEELKTLDMVVNDLTDIISIREVEYQSKEEINLSEELSQVKHILSAELNASGAQVIENFTECNEIHSIRGYVHSILLNLISNSVKYRSPERVPEIRVTARKKEHFVHITVQDNGLGIDLAKNGAKLFTLYKRFHNHIEGRGIGLYLVKNQVESLGGKIEAESKPDQGTTFRILLPVNKAPHEKNT
ncbi:MAG: PAS domain S-box protein [Chitinophagales bacterium]|nr:PAS domain S-box protein [Chitinophagales bacterium]